jgi:DNA-binding NarL/FixJ family response regulator
MGTSVLLYAAEILAMGVQRVLKTDETYALTCCKDLKAISTIASKYDIVVLSLEQDELDMDTIATIAARAKTVLWIHRALNLGMAVKAIKQKAWGILWKTSSPEDFLLCLQSVRLGQHSFEKTLTNDLAMSEVVNLSDREGQTAWLFGCGFSNKEIAAIMDISVRTVRAFMRLIHIKTGMGNSTELANLIRDNGYQPQYIRDGEIGSIPSLIFRQRENPRGASVKRSA